MNEATAIQIAMSVRGARETAESIRGVSEASQGMTRDLEAGANAAREMEERSVHMLAHFAAHMAGGNRETFMLARGLTMLKDSGMGLSMLAPVIMSALPLVAISAGVGLLVHHLESLGEQGKAAFEEVGMGSQGFVTNLEAAIGLIDMMKFRLSEVADVNRAVTTNMAYQNTMRERQVADAAKNPTQGEILKRAGADTKSSWDSDLSQMTEYVTKLEEARAKLGTAGPQDLKKYSELITGQEMSKEEFKGISGMGGYINREALRAQLQSQVGDQKTGKIADVESKIVAGAATYNAKMQANADAQAEAVRLDRERATTNFNDEEDYNFQIRQNKDDEQLRKQKIERGEAILPGVSEHMNFWEEDFRRTHQSTAPTAEATITEEKRYKLAYDKTEQIAERQKSIFDSVGEKWADLANQQQYKLGSMPEEGTKEAYTARAEYMASGNTILEKQLEQQMRQTTTMDMILAALVGTNKNLDTPPTIRTAGGARR